MGKVREEDAGNRDKFFYSVVKPLVRSLYSESKIKGIRKKIITCLKIMSRLLNLIFF